MSGTTDGLGAGKVPDVAEVVLAEVRESPLSVDEVFDAVRHPGAGGIATFVGVVRELAERLGVAGGVIRLAVVHRIGHLEIGDVAVVVAVSAAHRGAALDVCHELIDAVKSTVPIWKHQIFDDGSDEWVGTP